jgi:predicted dehydrogenase
MDGSRKLHIGLVGCGRQGSALAQAVLRSNSFELAACADPDEAAASRAAALVPDVSTHPSVDSLLAEREVDVIMVATPHHLLAPIALTGLYAGKHVLAEKPIALNAHEATEIERQAEKASVCYMAGYSFRYAAGKYIHEMLRQGLVGTIRGMTGSISIGPMDDGWAARPEEGGGPLYFVGTHLIDFFCWLSSDIAAEVYANIGWRSDTGADETTAFQAKFTKGAFVQGLVRQNAPSFGWTLDIQGDAGRLTAQVAGFTHIEIRVTSKVNAAYAEPTVIRPFVWEDHIDFMLVPELEAFAAAIRDQHTAPITAADGRRVLSIIDAIFESARSGRPALIK